MSVTQNTYVMVGALFNLEDLRLKYENLYDLLEPHMDRDDITILYDGMGSKYLAIGEVIEKSEDDNGLEDVHFIDGISENKLDIKKQINIMFRELGIEVGQFRIGYIILTHYR